MPDLATLLAQSAPRPWSWTSSARPGGAQRNVFNLYIVDRNDRKICAVWGKASEKEATADLIVALANGAA